MAQLRLLACRDRFLSIFTEKMSEEKLTQVVLQGKNHPLSKVTPYVLQQALRYINLHVPTNAASSIIKVACNIEDSGLIKWFVNNTNTVKWLEKQVELFNVQFEAADHLMIVPVEPDAKRVKISIRMPNLDEIEETEYKAMWTKHNPGLDTSHWSFLDNAAKYLRGGYILIYLMVNETSLDI